MLITVYTKQDDRIISQPHTCGEPIPEHVFWVDVLSPADTELVTIERSFGLLVPTKSEIWENQVLNRQYIENGIAYMTAAIITKMDHPYPDTSAITFILTPTFLLTVRYIAPSSFTNFQQRLQRSNEHFATPAHVLEALLEEIITRVAHNSEVVVDTLDALSHTIFGTDTPAPSAANSSQLMKEAIRKLGIAADLNSKINESLHSIIRLLSFFKQSVPTDEITANNISILITDGQTLIKQTSFLSDKITFLLDATLGMINVEQNMIIKIFSVATVFFLPPTLVSSFYGMNFKNMPELDWQYGYPMAITVMIILAVLPYFYFRKKGWL
jgi:magnesium transporter